MTKLWHEVRDGLHVFVHFDELEKRLLDSSPVQRLRGIHQLAMCYQVYPGATHTRFEHSIGVMDIAGRIFDRLLRDRLEDQIHDRLQQNLDGDARGYWRRVVRLAALLHDVGHLPFSHAAEESLLPEGWNHERLTAEIIRKSEIGHILVEHRPSINPEDVVDLAWDLKKRTRIEPNFRLPPWKTLFNEIITGDTFGADRIDYLLRDSWHAGVVYGRFDPHVLIDGLRIVINPNTEELALGLDRGAIHAAEALLLARFFMYTQVYFHDVRRVYDLHLQEFLQRWLTGGRFSENWEDLMRISDHEVLSAIRDAGRDTTSKFHEEARRILERRHFRTVYELTSTQRKKNPAIFEEIKSYAIKAFGEDQIRFDRYTPKTEPNDFWVVGDDASVMSSLTESEVIAKVPSSGFGFLFAHPDVKDEAKKGIDKQLQDLLSQKA